MHSLSKFIYTRILGWELVGVFPTLPKYIVAVVPHTSWLDFFIGLLVRSISRETINFVGKKELFNPLTSWFFRGLGGAPIDRSGNKGSVESMVAVFKAHDKFRIALAPEGTRKKVAKWKTGFYYIAKGANVPIVMATLDFGNKQIKISKAYTVTDDKEADFTFFHAFFSQVQGKNPDQF